MAPPNRIRADFSGLRAVDIAALMAVDSRTITRWVGQGVPRNDDGTFDAPSVIKWRISRAEARGESDQRQRLAAARAERVERENAIASGELLSATECLTIWQSILLDARSAFLNLGHKLAPRLAHQPAAVACKLIDDEVRQILTDLSEGRSENGLEKLQRK